MLVLLLLLNGMHHTFVYLILSILFSQIFNGVRPAFLHFFFFSLSNYLLPLYFSSYFLQMFPWQSFSFLKHFLYPFLILMTRFHLKEQGLGIQWGILSIFSPCLPPPLQIRSVRKSIQSTLENAFSKITKGVDLGCPVTPRRLSHRSEFWLGPRKKKRPEKRLNNDERKKYISKINSRNFTVNIGSKSSCQERISSKVKSGDVQNIC